nr:IS66 family transposase [Burkholderia sp. Bp9012]
MLMAIKRELHLPTVIPSSLSEQWHKLIRHIENGNWPISNNLCENAIRPFVVGCWRS